MNPNASAKPANLYSRCSLPPSSAQPGSLFSRAFTSSSLSLGIFMGPPDAGSMPRRGPGMANDEAVSATGSGVERFVPAPGPIRALHQLVHVLDRPSLARVDAADRN